MLNILIHYPVDSDFDNRHLSACIARNIRIGNENPILGYTKPCKGGASHWHRSTTTGMAAWMFNELHTYM